MSPWSVCSCTLVNPFLDVRRDEGRLVTRFWMGSTRWVRTSTPWPRSRCSIEFMKDAQQDHSPGFD